MCVQLAVPGLQLRCSPYLGGSPACPLPCRLFLGTSVLTLTLQPEACTRLLLLPKEAPALRAPGKDAERLRQAGQVNHPHRNIIAPSISFQKHGPFSQQPGDPTDVTKGANDGLIPRDLRP